MPKEIRDERIQTYTEDQERLKAQLLDIFAAEEKGTYLIFRFKRMMRDGLLVSREIVPIQDIYR